MLLFKYEIINIHCLSKNNQFLFIREALKFMLRNLCFYLFIFAEISKKCHIVLFLCSVSIGCLESLVKKQISFFLFFLQFYILRKLDKKSLLENKINNRLKILIRHYQWGINY